MGYDGLSFSSSCRCAALLPSTHESLTSGWFHGIHLPNSWHLRYRFLVHLFNKPLDVALGNEPSIRNLVRMGKLPFSNPASDRLLVPLKILGHLRDGVLLREQRQSSTRLNTGEGWMGGISPFGTSSNSALATKSCIIPVIGSIDVCISLASLGRPDPMMRNVPLAMNMSSSGRMSNRLIRVVFIGSPSVNINGADFNVRSARRTQQ